MDTRPQIVLPVEIDNLWLDYVAQPDLLRMAATCKRFRTIVTKHKGFYLCVQLLSIREDACTFVQRLASARKRGLQLSVVIDMLYVHSRRSRSTFETKISTELERCMHLVLNLSVLLASPLAAEYLLYPAPALRSFRYHIGDNSDGQRDPYSSSESENSSDSGLRDGLDEGDSITPDLFAGAAPRLTAIDLDGTGLPAAQIPAFGGVVDVRLAHCYSTSMGAMDVRLMFPSARKMSISANNGLVQKLRSPSDIRMPLPRSLLHLSLSECDLTITRLLRICDVSSVRHLHITHGTGRVSDWALLLPHITAPTHLNISVLPDGDATPPCSQNLTLSVALSSTTDTDKTLTFHATAGAWSTGVLLQLQSVLVTLVVLELPHMFLCELGSVSSLPSLRHMRIWMDGVAGDAFWQQISNNGAPVTPPSCPALGNIELSCARPEATVDSQELALFVRGLAAHCKPFGSLPRLALDGVVVTRGRHHEPYFTRESSPSL